jgi:hypothetical protein
MKESSIFLVKANHNRTATNYAMRYLNLQEIARRRAIRAAKTVN